MDNGTKAAVAVVGAAAVAGGVFAIYKLSKGSAKLANVIGTVVSGVDNTAISGAYVALGSAHTNTDSIGRFSFSNVKPATYDLDIVAAGYIEYFKPLVVAAGDNRPKIQLFKTAVQAGLAGKVTDINTSLPLAGVTVSTSGKTATTAADGTYSITGLVIGNITVTFTKAGYAQETATKTIMAGANTLDMQMDNMGTVEGFVRDSVTSAPISGATVKVGAGTATTNQNGTYTLKVVSGSSLQASASATNYQTQSTTVNLSPKMVQPLNFSLTQNFTQQGTIQGTVSNANSGNPIPGAILVFTGPDNYPHQISVVDPQGGYSIDLPSTSLGITYQIQATASGYQNYTSSLTLRTGTIVTKNIPMAPVPVPPGTIAGVVMDTSSHYLAGVSIRVVQNPGTAIVGTATTDSNGYYQIGNIPPGNYTVWGNKTGYSQASVDVTVVSGQTAVAPIIQLAPQGTAIGFFMSIEYDPSNWPTATYWYSSLNSRYFNYWAPVGELWDASQFDVSGDTTQTLLVQLVDENYITLATKQVPLGGAAGPLIRNGHVYAFNFDQASLTDAGTF